jgi:hypothetical protein
VLSAYAKYELQFWNSNIELVNGAPIRDPVHSVALWVDAGEHAFGAHTERTTLPPTPLPTHLINTSSTQRELYGLVHSAQALVSELKQRHVLIQMDSFAAIRNLINGGGPVQGLSALVKQWVSWCMTHGITATYKWIPREQNDKADRLSKALDRTYALSQRAMAMIQERWGAVTPFERSHVHTPTTNRLIAIPAFGQIANTIHIIEQYALDVVIVVPVWRGQAWWLRLREVKDTLELPQAAETLIPYSKENAIALRRSGWEMTAVRLNADSTAITSLTRDGNA